ncbi:MAG TPA: hypothetical protein VE621_18025 [Bryobacteraceae bacterium]|nr:hypothetical protein [Bryobacteraceae bacterium]
MAGADFVRLVGDPEAIRMGESGSQRIALRRSPSRSALVPTPLSNRDVTSVGRLTADNPSRHPDPNPTRFLALDMNTVSETVLGSVG